EIVRGGLGNPLEASNDVISEEANRAAEEPGQAGKLRGAKSLDLRAELIEAVGDRPNLDTAAGPDDIHPVAARPNHHRGFGAEKGVAAQLFAAAHAVEQEIVVAARDLQERRNRSFKVRRDFARHRNQVIALAAQLFEFALRWVHHREFPSTRPLLPSDRLPKEA